MKQAFLLFTMCFLASLQLEAQKRTSQFCSLTDRYKTGNPLNLSKLQLIVTEKLDSVIWYANDGDMQTIGMMERYHYNNMGQCTGAYYVDAETGDTIIKENYGYNNQGLLSEVVVYERGWADENETVHGEFEFQYKKEFTYDANQRLSTEIELRIIDTEQMQYSDKYEYVYDGNKLYQRNYYYWENNAWSAKDKRNYLYNGQGKIHVTNGYSMEGNDWVFDETDTVTYDSESREIQRILYWKNTSKWEIDYKAVTEYKDNTMTSYYYQMSEGSLVLEQKTKITLELDIPFEDVYYPYVYNDPEGDENLPYKILKYEAYESADDETANETMIFFYSSYTTAIKNEIHSGFSIYPNPASEYIKLTNNNPVTVTSFELFDITGKLVKQVNTTGNETITIGSLPNGTYFYRAISANGVYNGKLIKK